MPFTIHAMTKTIMHICLIQFNAAWLLNLFKIWTNSVGCKTFNWRLFTVCPRSSDPFYLVTHYIKWVPTSWTDSTNFIKTMDSPCKAIFLLEENSIKINEW